MQAPPAVCTFFRTLLKRAVPQPLWGYYVDREEPFPSHYFEYAFFLYRDGTCKVVECDAMNPASVSRVQHFGIYTINANLEVKTETGVYSRVLTSAPEPDMNTFRILSETELKTMEPVKFRIVKPTRLKRTGDTPEPYWPVELGIPRSEPVVAPPKPERIRNLPRMRAESACLLCGVGDGSDPSHEHLCQTCWNSVRLPQKHTTAAPPTQTEMLKTGRWPWFPLNLPADADKLVTVPRWALKNGDAFAIDVVPGDHPVRIAIGNQPVDLAVFEIVVEAAKIVLKTVPTPLVEDNQSANYIYQHEENMIVIQTWKDKTSVFVNGKKVYVFNNSSISLTDCKHIYFQGESGVISRVVYNTYSHS
ncbi:hypothetical protein Pelo_14022 [Pelomyxa schiedti]|nr:hypothetical protein Pelo_14022 [Pelomyxa schiedti]